MDRCRIPKPVWTRSTRYCLDLCVHIPRLYVQSNRYVDGTLAFAFLMLTIVIPYQSSPGRQRIQVYLWNGVIMLVYSVLITLFRVKNRGWRFIYHFTCS